MDPALLLAIGTVLGSAITLIGRAVTDYRKAADAGQLEIVKAQQAGLTEQVAQLQTSVRECQEDRTDLRGQLKMMQIQVARDTSETLRLSESHGQMKEEVAQVKKQLQNGGSQ